MKKTRIGVLVVLFLLYLAVGIPAVAVETPAGNYRLTFSGFSVGNGLSSEVWSIKGAYRVAPDLMARVGLGSFFAEERATSLTEVTSLMMGGIYTLAPLTFGDSVLFPYIGGEIGRLIVSPTATYSAIQIVGGVELQAEEFSRLSLSIELKYLISSMEIAEGTY